LVVQRRALRSDLLKHGRGGLARQQVTVTLNKVLVLEVGSRTEGVAARHNDRSDLKDSPIRLDIELSGERVTLDGGRERRTP